ncbi:HAD family hydrolase [Schaalia suimastitidis]|uniref:HAD family hydrolase n=1 Tax=Schaalia suimastitidis TaxID=121163 RepID=UPI00042098E1|nr:HAD family hydrolase [Schaalia suimastitidis]
MDSPISHPCADNKRRLVFIDIDGTLVTHDQQIPDSAFDACQQAVTNGHRLLLCSGRSIPEIYPRLWEPGFTGVIASGGGYAKVDGHVLVDARLSAADIQRVNALLDSLGAQTIWQGTDAFYHSQGFFEFFNTAMKQRNNDSWDEYTQAITPYLKPGLPTTISKCTSYIDRQRITYEELAMRVPSGVRMVPGSIGAGSTLVAEFMPEGVSKGAAITAVAHRLGFPLDATIALGDSHNDIEALSTAGVGVAMGNAPSQVRDAADYVTADVASDGLALAFDYLGLI